MNTLPHATLSELLSTMAQRRGDAVYCIEGDRHYSFNALEQASLQLSQQLLAMGIGAGDRIGLLALNQIEWVALFFAATRIGAAVVGMSTRYRDSELRYMVQDSQVKAVFTLGEHEGHDFMAMFERLRPDLPTLRAVVNIDRGDAEPLDSLARALQGAATGAPAQPKSDLDGADLAMIIYTSGTTGRPKGAGLTHASLLGSARVQAAHMRIVPGDLLQLATPLNHVGGITCGVLSLLTGGATADLVSEFKAPLVIARMRAHPPTLLGGVPTMMTLLLMHARDAGLDWSTLRIIFIGGSNVDGSLLAQLRACAPQATLMNLYGLSESSGAIVMTPWGASEDDLIGSIGKALAEAEVRVVSSDRQKVLAAGEVGELCFRGAGVIPGYVGAAAAVADAFSADGWLYTGDLGMVDARGYITLKGRAKDMFIQGGFNVYPAEVEAYIARHPAVLLVAGIGVSDPVLGEIGRYYIVRRPGMPLEGGQLREFCAEGLADYKIPRQFVFRDELPLTPAGKIQKAALRDEPRG